MCRVRPAGRGTITRSLSAGAVLTSTWTAPSGVVTHQITTTPFGDVTRFGKQFSPFAEYFNGPLDDVRIYNNAISGTDVAALAAAGPSGAVTVPEAGTLAFLLPALGFLGVWQSRRSHALLVCPEDHSGLGG
jgi:hypothetical protein